MTEEELTAIEKRANAATREPWIVGDAYVPTASLSAVSVYGMGMEVAECQMDTDGAFIAAARADVPALIAEVRRLRVLTDGLKEIIGLLRGSAVAGWCAECKGSGYITTHLGSEGSGTVATRKCVCGGNPFLRNATAEFWLEER